MAQGAGARNCPVHMAVIRGRLTLRIERYALPKSEQGSGFVRETPDFAVLNDTASAWRNVPPGPDH